MHDEGAGREQNPAEAAAWYHKAAKQGFVDAQTNLAMMYYHGHGVPCDHEEASKWFSLAAKQGDKEAAATLVIMGNST